MMSSMSSGQVTSPGAPGRTWLERICGAAVMTFPRLEGRAGALRGYSPYTRYPPGAVTLRIPGRPLFVQV